MNIQVLASGSSGNCYCISDGQTQILLEAGINIKKIQAKLDFGLSNISGVLLSHAHRDHSLSISDLADRYGINCYMHKDTANALNLRGYRIRTISHSKQFQIGTFVIVPFDLPHINVDSTPCANLGYLIYSTATKETLFFATDCMYIKNTFSPCEIYLVETNYTEDVDNVKSISVIENRRYNSHMSLNTALKFLQNQDLSKCKKIYAIHLSDTMCNEQEIYSKLTEATKKEVIIC